MKIIVFLCRSIDQSVDYAGVDSHGRGKKKKKKKNKTHQDDTSSRIDEAGIAMEEVKTELIEKIEQKDQAHRSKVRTFSSGLVIEELSMGKQEDKRADRGNKVSPFLLIYLLMSGQADHGLCPKSYSYMVI